MIKVLIPVFLLLIVAAVVLVIHKRESKGAKAKRLEAENTRLKAKIDEIDTAAHAEYAVTNSTFAWNVTDKIKDNA